MLIKHGADVNAEGGDRDRPLHDAIINGHAQVVTLLLKNGALEVCAWAYDSHPL